MASQLRQSEWSRREQRREKTTKGQEIPRNRRGGDCLNRVRGWMIDAVSVTVSSSTRRNTEIEQRRGERRGELPGAVLSYSLRSSRRWRGEGKEIPTVVSLSRKILSYSYPPACARVCRGSRGRKSRNGSSSLDDARDSPHLFSSLSPSYPFISLLLSCVRGDGRG